MSTKRFLILFASFALVLGMGLLVTKQRSVIPTAGEVISSVYWGLGFGEDGTVPTGTNTSEELSNHGAIYVVEDAEKTIYLTFDCGYENGNTEKILDALKAHNAKGTFFIVGHFLESAPELVKRMVAEGHTVANHTYHHPDMSAVSEEEFEAELADIATAFYELTGQKLASLYRPPQGKYTLESLDRAKQAGYLSVFWSLAYMDWDVNAQPSKEEAFEKLLPRIHDGAIVLLHNTSDTNGEIMDELLSKWEEMGYSFGILEDALVE